MEGGVSSSFPRGAVTEYHQRGISETTQVSLQISEMGRYKFKIDIVSGEGHFPARKTLLCPHVVKDMRELTRNFACVP